MRPLYIVFLLLILITSCKEKQATKDHEPKTDSVEEMNEKEIIIQKILDIPKLQEMYHSEIANRIPIKLVVNDYVNDRLKLKKFNQPVRLASMVYYAESNTRDYLIFEHLTIKSDTATFELQYPIEGVAIKGSFTKVIGEWTILDHEVVETSSLKATLAEPQNITKNDVQTIAYKGGDLGYLASQYYGNKAFRNVLSAYNSFADKRTVDKKQDSIKIPELSYLYMDASLPKLHPLDEHLEKVIKARNLYLKHEKALWELPKDSENRNFRSVPHALKLELLGTSKLLFESISGLEQNENSPKKAIGQFRQVAVNLENIAKGNIDENGYALDMVHQRMALGFSNSIRWAKE